MITNKTRYDELVQLAGLFSFKPELPKRKTLLPSRSAAIAKEYQRRAAELDGGRMPDIGEE